jgi:hypothetical protein
VSVILKAAAADIGSEIVARLRSMPSTIRLRRLRTAILPALIVGLGIGGFASLIDIDPNLPVTPTVIGIIGGLGTLVLILLSPDSRS